MNRRGFLQRLAVAVAGFVGVGLARGVGVSADVTAVFDPVETRALLAGLTWHPYSEGADVGPWTGWFENANGRVVAFARRGPDRGGPDQGNGELLATMRCGCCTFVICPAAMGGPPGGSSYIAAVRHFGDGESVEVVVTDPHGREIVTAHRGYFDQAPPEDSWRLAREIADNWNRQDMRGRRFGFQQIRDRSAPNPQIAGGLRLTDIEPHGGEAPAVGCSLR